MTLVELMVSLAVTALVMASVVGIFASQHRNYVRDRSEKEVLLDTVDVIRMLEREIREAGWSVPANMALFIQDGGDNGPDRIYMNDVDLIDPMRDASRLVESSCPGCLKVDNNTGTKVKLTDPWDPFREDILDINADNQTDFVGDNKSYVITDSTSTTHKVACVKEVSSTTLTLKSPVNGSFLAPAIYYCVDDGHNDCHGEGGAREACVLRRCDRNTQGLVPVADNVVDLQVAYLVTDDGPVDRWYGEAGCSGSGIGENKCTRSPFEPERIRLIRLNVVLRSPTKDKDRLNDPRFCRPAVENHHVGTGADECGYQYKVHTVHIHPRNTLMRNIP